MVLFSHSIRIVSLFLTFSLLVATTLQAQPLDPPESFDDPSAFAPIIGGENLGEETISVKPEGARLIAFLPGYDMKIPIIRPSTGAASMQYLVREMQQDARFNGMYKEWRMLTYPQDASMEQIADSVERQLFDYINQYGVRSVTVDLVGHSFGTAAAMFGAANDTRLFFDRSVVSSHIGRVVNLAGVNFGQDKLPPRNTSQGLRQLYPYIDRNPYLQNWITAHRNQINSWDMCAGYSRDDIQVNSPHNSGCMGISRGGVLYTAPSRCYHVANNETLADFTHIRWVTPGERGWRKHDRLFKKMYRATTSTCWGFLR